MKEEKSIRLPLAAVRPGWQSAKILRRADVGAGGLIEWPPAHMNMLSPTPIRSREHIDYVVAILREGIEATSESLRPTATCRADRATLASEAASTD